MRPVQGLAFAGLVVSTATVAAPPQQLDFEMVGTLPVLSAHVAGRPVRLLLDTGGGSALALRPETLAAMIPGQSLDQSPNPSPNPSPNQPPASVPASPSDAAASARPVLPSLPLQFGEGEPVDLPATVWRKPAYPPGIDGYLGWGYLRRFSLVVDYRGRQLQLWPAGALAPVCAAPPAVLRQLGSLPYVTVEHEGQPLPLGLDTGANQNVLIAGRVPAAATPGAHRVLAPASWEGRPLALGSFKVIELKLPVLAGFLGHGFFASHRVCLDAQSASVSIEPLAP